MRKLYFALIVFILAGNGNIFCQTATFTCNSTSEGTGSIQTFTVPPCVDTITIDARGAQGGNGGGLGADMVGTFVVTPGQVLNILVGQAGTVNGDGGSGGGGSFVADLANTAWIVAGGGGGTSGTGSAGDPGLNTTAAGNAGNDGGTGGSAGGGGGGGVDNASCTSGDGGGGFCGNGGGSSNGGAVGAGGAGCVNGGNATGAPLCAGGGLSYLNGGAGGFGCTGGGGCSNNAISGGYGGGGGACGSGGGGGGGYSGGGGGGYSFLNGGEGGGGGSYNNGINQANTAGVQSGNGEVIITWKASSATATIGPSTEVSCFGGNNGSATVTATGGGPYTYSWSTAPVQTTQTATGLSAGTYTATITDALGCTAKDSVTITEPAALRDSIVSFTNVSVACGSNGSATVGVKGTGPFTYSWAPTGGTNATANNLAAGIYTVNVTSSGGCTTKDSVTITQPPSLTATIPTTVNDLCNGGNTGSATVSVTGGNAPYAYSWNNGETSAKDSLLPAGTYTISVTDANGCTVKANVTITQPQPIRDSIAAATNVLCNGGNTGTATEGVKGGTSPYTFTWTNAQTTPTATGLTAGSYTVIVKDLNGCKDSSNITITQPAVLKLTGAAFATSCHGTCDGSVNVIPAGGTGPYKYTWSNSATTANVTNLCAGTYSVIVTDANGCIHDTNPITITQPPAITMTINSTSAYCNQADGSASVTAAGGTPPYKYLWSTGITTTNLSNVPPGTYCCGVQDANNCQDTVCVVVPNTSGEKASIANVVNVTCNGGINGSITGSAAGGTGPYTYSWSTAPVQTTQTATGLQSGTYTLTVTDATGCQDTAIATVGEPAPINITVAGNGQICIGKTDILTATATGGTGPYTFTWNTTSVGTSYSVSPIVTTSYTVVATDVNGCKSTATVIPVKVRDSIKVITNSGKTMCAGDTAVLTSLATGGDSTYTYSWAPGGATTQNIIVSPTSTTTYTVTVNDGCSPPVQKTVLVNLFPSRPISFSADTLKGCQAICISFIDSVAGVLKTITWNFGDGGSATSTNPTHCYTSPGVYSVSLTVTNDSGCVVSKTIPSMITVYPNPVANFSWNPQNPTSIDPTISFFGQSVDTIVSWVWSFGDKSDSTSFQKNTEHTYGDTGIYCPSLIVTDNHGCHDTVDHCIDILPQFTIYIPNAFTPNGDGLNDVFLPKGDYIENFEMFIFDRWGQQIFHTTDIYNGWDGTMHGNKVQEDTYVYLISCTDPANAKQYSYMGKVSVVR